MNRIATFSRDYAAALFLFPVGLMFLIFGFILFLNINPNTERKETTAVVSRTELTEEGGHDEDPLYDVYVKYIVAGQKYEELYGTFSDYQEGDTLKIKYNPENPKEIGEPISLLHAFIFAGIGILLLFGGIINSVYTFKKNKALKKEQKGWIND